MSSNKIILFKLVIIFVILTVSESSKSAKKNFDRKNFTKLVRRGLNHGASTHNRVGADYAPKLRNMKRSPLSDTNVGQAAEDNTVDDKVSPSGPTVTLSIDPGLASTFANAEGDPQHFETLRKEVMAKVLDSAMKKIKEMIINKGGNINNVPTFHPPSTIPSKSPISLIKVTSNLDTTTRKSAGSTKRFPTRQIMKTFPLIVRAPSSMAPATNIAAFQNNTTESTTTNSPNEESSEHSQEKNKEGKNKPKYNKKVTVVKLPPIHLTISKLDQSYIDDDKSASKEILTDVLDKDQFWRIIEDDDETSLDDTEELENEELLRMLVVKAKEKRNETITTTLKPKKTEVREAEITTPCPFDFRAPRRLRPEVQRFVNSVQDFFVNIYNALTGPWYKKLF